MRSVLAAVLLCLLAPACGGDGDGDDEAVDAFRAEAEGICTDIGPKIAAIPPPATSDEEWAAIAADKGDLLETAVNQLGALEPPGGVAESFGAWLALKREALTVTRELQEAGGFHDEQGIDAALSRLEEIEQEADPLAQELELAECGADGW